MDFRDKRVFFEQNPDNMNLSSDSQDENDSTAHESALDTASSTSENDASSDYSDWTADNGMKKLEPPKRVARVRNRRATRMTEIVDSPVPQVCALLGDSTI